MEERIKPWLQPHLDRRLRDPVGYRRDAQHPHAPGLLRNWHSLYRRRKIAAGTHPIPKPVQAAGELRLEPLDRLCVDPCGSMIGLHTQPSFPDQCLGNVVRFAGHGRFLPVARLISGPPDDAVLRSSAIAAVSTLLRTAPSLTALRYDRPRPFGRDLSLGIADEGSRSTRQSQRQDRAASMPDAVWPVSRHRPD